MLFGVFAERRGSPRRSDRLDDDDDSKGCNAADRAGQARLTGGSESLLPSCRRGTILQPLAYSLPLLRRQLPEPFSQFLTALG